MVKGEWTLLWELRCVPSQSRVSQFFESSEPASLALPHAGGFPGSQVFFFREGRSPFEVFNGDFPEVS